jgi:hypothetical protein
MAIDMASVYAARYRKQPDMLRAAVMGQSPDPKLDSYTALNALRLVKEADMMAMAGQAQQPTSAPSIVAQNLAPPPMMQGLGAMVPGAMGQAPQGMPPQQRAPMPQPTMQAASGGLAGMYTPEEDFAEGGIVAFQSGGLNAPAVTDDATRRLVGSGNDEDDGSDASMNFPMFTSRGDPETYGKLAAIYPGIIENLGNVKETEIKPEQLRKVSADEIAAYREAMGPNIAMDTLRADIAARKGERDRNLEEGKGVALLKAAMAVTQGSNWVRAFAGAGAAFGDEYTRALKADKEEKRSIAAAEFNMADAKRKEDLGLFKEGRAAQDRYVSSVKAADKARLDKAKAYADAVAKGMNATKPLRSAFSGAGAGGPKLPQVDREAALITKQIIALEAKDPNDPQIAVLKKQRAGLIEILGTGKEGPTAATRATNQLTGAQNRQLSKEMSAWQDSTEAKKALKAGTFDEAYDAEFTRRQNALMSGISTTPSSGNVINYDANGKRIN